MFFVKKKKKILSCLVCIFVISVVVVGVFKEHSSREVRVSSTINRKFIFFILINVFVVAVAASISNNKKKKQKQKKSLRKRLVF